MAGNSWVSGVPTRMPKREVMDSFREIHATLIWIMMETWIPTTGLPSGTDIQSLHGGGQTSFPTRDLSYRSSSSVIRTLTCSIPYAFAETHSGREQVRYCWMPGLRKIKIQMSPE